MRDHFSRLGPGANEPGVARSSESVVISPDKPAGMKTGLIYGQAKGSSEAGPATANAQVLRAPKPKTAKNKQGISKHDAGQPHDRVVPVASFVDDVKRKVAIRKTMLDTTTPKPAHVARQLKHLKKDLKKELTNKTLTADDSWDVGEPATIILPPHKHPKTDEGGPGSGPRPGYKKHPGPGSQMQRVGELPKAQQRIATHAIRRQFARGEQAEGGPGSGPRSKFQPEEKPGEEERQIATFTRREKPGERAGRIAKKPVDPAMAKAIRKALMAKREALVNDETPGPGRLWQKEDVNYRYNSDISRSCGTCEHYIAPGSCEIVSGLIRPVDVCDKWESMEDEMKSSGLVPSQLVMLSYQLGEADLNSKGGMLGKHISTEAKKFGPGGFNVGHAPGLPTKPGFTDIKGKGTGVKVHKPVKKTTVDKQDGSNVPTDLAEDYIGFAKLKKKLAGQKGIYSPGGLAATIGTKKYGKAGMAKKAAAGRKKSSEALVPSMLVMRHPPGPERLIQSQLCDLTPPLVKLWRQAKKSGQLDLQREVSPPGWEGTVKAMKRHGEITNPWALAWWMKGQGMTPHKKAAEGGPGSGIRGHRSDAPVVPRKRDATAAGQAKRLGFKKDEPVPVRHPSAGALGYKVGQRGFTSETHDMPDHICKPAT